MTEPVTDLERFFRHLVSNLVAADPARLRHPLPLAEIRNSIVPYRANRRALQLESSEDYELVLMRLCAGEGGFARTEPEEVRAEFAKEVGSPNPDLTVVERHEKAVLILDPQAIGGALAPKPDLAYAPQERVSPEEHAQGQAAASPELPAGKPRKTAPETHQAEDKTLRCTRCGGDLPVGRVVNFCPQCGQSLAHTRCPECKTKIEPGWRHCVGCGLPLTGR